MQQDYLYMFQICVALGALLAFYFSFKCETLDKYADNRKGILRDLLETSKNPERAEWIQSIGKPGNVAYEKQMIDMKIPSVETLVLEIKNFRLYKSRLRSSGIIIAVIWVVMSVVYLFSQTFNWYGESPCWSWWPYKVLMLLFLAACLKTGYFIWKAKER